MRLYRRVLGNVIGPSLFRRQLLIFFGFHCHINCVTSSSCSKKAAGSIRRPRQTIPNRVVGRDPPANVVYLNRDKNHGLLREIRRYLLCPYGDGNSPNSVLNV
jgi:hypothetical protein